MLNHYPGLSPKLPGLSPAQKAVFNLLLICAGIGSPGPLVEMLCGYRGVYLKGELLRTVPFWVLQLI
jgi:hypothetical protein